VRFAFIDEEKATWPVDAMCEVLSVSRSGFYAWKARPPSPRALDDAQLVVEIKAAHKAGRGAYGSPRVHRALRKQGRRVGKKRIEQLMRREGVAAKKRKKSASPPTRGTRRPSQRSRITSCILQYEATAFVDWLRESD